MFLYKFVLACKNQKLSFFNLFQGLRIHFVVKLSLVLYFHLVLQTKLKLAWHNFFDENDYQQAKKNICLSLSRQVPKKIATGRQELLLSLFFCNFQKTVLMFFNPSLTLKNNYFLLLKVDIFYYIVPTNLYSYHQLLSRVKKLLIEIRLQIPSA